MVLVRHPEVAAKRPSKEAAEALGLIAIGITQQDHAPAKSERAQPIQPEPIALEQPGPSSRLLNPDQRPIERNQEHQDDEFHHRQPGADPNEVAGFEVAVGIADDEDA